MNTAKIKLVVFSKTNIHASLTLHEKPMDQVPFIKYKSKIVNQQSDAMVEIKTRIEQTQKTLNNMKLFLTNRNHNIKLRIRLLPCYILPVLLYECESWTLDASKEKQIDAFEMYAYRRMLRVSWTKHKTNVEILKRIEK